MYKYSILIYFIILGLLIKTQNIAFIISFIVLGILIIALISPYRKMKQKSIEESIKKYPHSAVLNVNKASWWELEMLPDVSTVQAKKMVWLRNHNGKYKTIEEFLNKNNIQNKDVIEKLVSI